MYNLVYIYIKTSLSFPLYLRSEYKQKHWFVNLRQWVKIRGNENFKKFFENSKKYMFYIFLFVPYCLSPNFWGLKSIRKLKDYYISRYLCEIFFFCQVVCAPIKLVKQVEGLIILTVLLQLSFPTIFEIEQTVKQKHPEACNLQ